MVVVPLPHPDSTVPGRSAPYWLVPVVEARSGPSDSQDTPNRISETAYRRLVGPKRHQGLVEPSNRFLCL